MKTLRVAMVAALAMAGTSAIGQISVDADAFPAGTDLTNAFAGVTLTSTFSGPVFSHTAPAGRATTGRRVFGNSAFSGFEDEWGSGAPTLLVSFASPVRQVWLDFIGNDSFDIGGLRAFDSNGVLIGAIETGGLGLNQSRTLTMMTTTPRIAWLEAGGDFSGAQSISLDNLRYVVPTPGAVAVLGLAGLRLTRRSR